MRKYVFVLLLLLLFLPTPWANAQDKGQVGLAMGYPATVAMIFHATDSLAIRPDFVFSTSSTTNNYSTNSTTNDGTSLGVGVSAIFYAAKWDNLRAYFSPRFGYQRTTNDYSGSSTSTVSSSKSSTYGVSGSFGAQYSLGRRFAVFGEVGLAYSHLTGESSSNATTTPVSSGSGNAWSTRTAIGGIFYFK